MVSVIIPMYNTAQYIQRCVDSVLSCNFKDIEIIIIDDGSEDGSMELCKKLYQDKDNIILIEQANQGVSYARNVGIEASSGEWIIFVDSDDYISDDYFYEFDNVNSEYDLLIMDRCKDNLLKSEFSEQIYQYKKEDITEIIKKTIKFEQLIPTGNVTLRGPVCKIYRSSIIKEHNIRFSEKITMGEDELFNIQYYSYCETIRYINKPVYHVEKRKGSITRSYIKDIFNNIDCFNQCMKKLLVEQGRWEDLKMVYYDNVLSGVIYILCNGIFCDGNPGSMSEKKRQCENLRRNNINQDALTYLWKLGSFKRKILLQMFSFKLYDLVALISNKYTK